MLKVIFAGVLLALLASCASSPSAPEVEVVEAQGADIRSMQGQSGESQAPLPQDEAPEDVSPASAPDRTHAIDELLTQARLQYRYGEYQYAVRTAERGLRIDRSQSEWYLILSESYLKLGSAGNAKQFARQGLRYSNPVGQHYQRLKQISDGQY